MSLTNFNGINNYLPGTYPVAQVTPFTYREGATMLHIIDSFKEWAKQFGPAVEQSLNKAFEEFQKQIDLTKAGWQELFDRFIENVVEELQGLNDQAVANLVNDPLSKTRPALDSLIVEHINSNETHDVVNAWIDSRFNDIHDHVVDIRQHGGKDISGHDNYPALQSAMNEIETRGGGTIVFPGKRFEFSNAVRLVDNVTVDLCGSTLALMDDHVINAIFMVTSQGKHGYGSGVKNAVIKNGVIQGNFARETFVGMSIHHADGVLIENVIFNQAIGNGHSLDIMGSRNVAVKNCRFQGRMLIEGRNYVEAIQVDHSSRGGAGSALPEPLSSYDGLPTRDVLIENCHSEPLIVNNQYYYAPRLVGSHSRVADVRHKNIVIRDCSITDSGVTDGDGRYVGWIHFTHADGLLIDGLTLNNTRADAAVGVGLWGVDTTYPLDSVQQPSPALNGDAGSVSSKNVVIRNVKTSGFKSTVLTPLIRVHGSNDTSYLKNVVVDGVTVEGGHSGKGASEGVYVISGAFVDGISVSNIVADTAARGVNLEASKNISINNVVVSEWCSVGVRLLDCIETAVGNVSVKGNNLANISGGSEHIFANSKHVVSGTGDIEYAATLGITTCKNFQINGVILKGLPGSVHEFGIRAYGNATNGVIVGCTVEGIAPAVSYANAVNVEAFANIVA